MTRYLLEIKWSVALALLWSVFAITMAIYAAGCKSPGPDRPYATDEVAPVTEQPRDASSVTNRSLTGELQTRNLPDLPRNGRVFNNVNEMYRYYTNATDDRLVERHQILGPPVLPSRGPFPTHVVPQTTVSNWMTPKAMTTQPKLVVTNQIPGSVILSRITTTGSDGKPFTAELELHGNQTIQANDRMAVVIFSISTSNYVIETCENIAEGRWSPLTSGTGQDTNSALVVVDLYATNQPIKFYRQKAMP